MYSRVGRFLKKNLFWMKVPLECVPFNVEFPITGQKFFYLRSLMGWGTARPFHSSFLERQFTFNRIEKMCHEHRYLMTRLSLQVVYLWRHVSSTAPPFILWWSNLEILFGPLHRNSPFIGDLRYQMEHAPYIAERTQKEAVYIVRCLWSWVGVRKNYYLKTSPCSVDQNYFCLDSELAL
jgi:hypothetical protein